MNLSRIFLVGLGVALSLLGFFVIYGNPTHWVNLLVGIILILFGVAIIVKKDITIE